jgi:predicted RNase H-like nuclease (RuvC/YqgF family)
VCTNTLRRPVEEIDAEIIAWIKANILQESTVKWFVAEVRRRIAKQGETRGADIERLDAQIAKLRKQVRNLCEAVALANVSIPALAEKLADSQAELSKLEARAAATRTAPAVLSLECRRLERDLTARLEDLRGVLSRNPKRAREALQAVLIDKLTFRPVETADGKRYEVTGRLVVGGIFRLPAEALMIASPGGHSLW